MAQETYTQFVTNSPTATTPLAGSELVEIIQSGISKKIPVISVTGGASGTVSPYQFGAIADGGSHPLSTVYSTLADARAAYPLIPNSMLTSLTQEIDWAASQQAAFTAWGAPGVENSLANVSKNLRFYWGPGTYYFGNDTFVVRNTGSTVMFGNGEICTQITGNTTVLLFDGLWYTTFQDFNVICLTTGATGGALVIDGNSALIPGHTYATFGVQGCTFINVQINGGGSPYAYTNGFYSTGVAQQGSEMQHFNVHLNNATTACYAQWGFNALDNQFWGGDAQAYQKHGLYSNNSAIQVFGTSFESTAGLTQYTNGGYDIYFNASGAGSVGVIVGCRSESMQFHFNGGSNFSKVIACALTSSLGGWFANNAYAQNAAILIPGINRNRGQVFLATTPGTSGGTQPTWPLTGTVSDGSITWTYLSFDTIFIQPGNGSVDQSTVVNNVNGGNINASTGIRAITKYATSDYTVGYTEFIDDIIIADATTGAITITILGDWQNPVTVRKVDTTANTVTVTNVLRGFDTGSTNDVFAGGARATRTYLLGNSASGGIAYNIISASTI